MTIFAGVYWTHMPQPFVVVVPKPCLNCSNPLPRATSKRDGFESPQHYYRRKYCSRSCSSRHHGANAIRRYVATHGHPLAGKPSHSRGKPRYDIRGDKHPNWQGGITSPNKAARRTLEYIEWRRAVFLRDNHTCRLCGVRGVYLEADHIKPFALFPALRTSIENGRTLCRPCHEKTDTYRGRVYQLQTTN